MMPFGKAVEVVQTLIFSLATIEKCAFAQAMLASSKNELKHDLTYLISEKKQS